MLRARLREEASAWSAHRPTGFQLLRPCEGSAEWTGFVPGPSGTPWEGGLYVVRVAFPDEYPHAPPTCTFVPPVWHPNVSPTGRIALGVLEPAQWVPQTHVRAVLMAVQALLREPDTRRPVNAEAYAAVRSGAAEYGKRAALSARSAAPAAGIALGRTRSQGGQGAAGGGSAGGAAENGDAAGAARWPPSEKECGAIRCNATERFDSFLKRKKDPAQKDAFKAHFQEPLRALVNKARNGPPKTDDSLAARKKELLDVLRAAREGEPLEFALLCFLKTAAEWLAGIIPDSAVVSLPINVGHIAAEASAACKNAHDFNTLFVAYVCGLPHGSLVLVDAAAPLPNLDGEPWAAQDKLRARVQIVLRVHFAFVEGLLPAAEWVGVALSWLRFVCEPARIVLGVTSVCVLQFLRSLSTALNKADSARFSAQVRAVKETVRQCVAKERELMRYIGEGDSRVVPKMSPEVLPGLLNELEGLLAAF